MFHVNVIIYSKGRVDILKKTVLSIILVLILCSQALAETSVWKVQKGGSVMYLGGTFHLLRQSEYPLPVEFEKAYRASNVLVFETNIGKLKDPVTQQKLMEKAMYNNGATIENYLTNSTYKRLAEYCAASGLPLENLKQFKPAMIALTLTFVELAKLGVSPEGADMFFYQKALQDKKAMNKLESVDKQIQFITAMGEGYEDAFITYSLKDLNVIKQKYEEMVNAWKTGNDKQTEALILNELRKKMPIIYKELLLDRNNLWLPKIEAYGKTPQKEFILVGVGHLVGPDGIVTTLRSKGYKVEKL